MGAREADCRRILNLVFVSIKYVRTAATEGYTPHTHISTGNNIYTGASEEWRDNVSHAISQSVSDTTTARRAGDDRTR